MDRSRLHSAAQRVEDTVAPRVAELLSTAAQKVDPAPPLRAVSCRARSSTSVPESSASPPCTPCCGCARPPRTPSGDAHLENAREQVRQTRQQLAARARQTRGKLWDSPEAAETAAPPEAAATGSTSSELNSQIKQ